jgi:hypothetical protein
MAPATPSNPKCACVMQLKNLGAGNPDGGLLPLLSGAA